MGKFFDDIKAGLEEAIEFEKGKTTLRTRFVELPEPPKQYNATDVKRIREENNYSQSILAIVLNVSVKTVRAWECDERIPSHAALRLLELVDKGIYHPVHNKPITTSTRARRRKSKKTSSGINGMTAIRRI